MLTENRSRIRGLLPTLNSITISYVHCNGVWVFCFCSARSEALSWAGLLLATTLRPLIEDRLLHSWKWTPVLHAFITFQDSMRHQAASDRFLALSTVYCSRLLELRLGSMPDRLALLLIPPRVALPVPILIPSAPNVAILSVLLELDVLPLL